VKSPCFRLASPLYRNRRAPRDLMAMSTGAAKLEIEAVLSDTDGTLVDSNEEHVNAWAFAFQEEKPSQELDDIRAQIGKGGDLLVPAFLPDVDSEIQKRIAERQGRIFKELYLAHVRAFEGAAEIVRRVRASGRKAFLASSAKGEKLQHYVRLLDIEECLTATTSIDDVQASKPEPDIFVVALEKGGVDPARAIVVGDTPYDVEAARRAGVAAVGVTTGPFDEQQLKDAGAIAVFASVAGLLEEFDNSPLAA
jgi:HAD superfamily hydrolase (TIGR01509 family)